LKVGELSKKGFVQRRVGKNFFSGSGGVYPHGKVLIEGVQQRLFFGEGPLSQDVEPCSKKQYRPALNIYYE